MSHNNNKQTTNNSSTEFANIFLNVSSAYTVFKQQEQNIIDYILFNCYEENENEPDLMELKKYVYESYTNTDAPIISEIEIYIHDLPAELIDKIVEIVQMISKTENMPACDKKRAACEYIKFRKAFFTQELYKTLIDLYIDRVKWYKKLVKNFNHKGIKEKNGVPFYKVVKPKIDKTKKEYKQIKKQYYTCRRNKSYKAKITSVNFDFKKVLEGYREIIRLYEEYCPNIINNGYNYGTFSRLFNVLLSYIIPMIVTIFSIIYYLKKG